MPGTLSEPYEQPTSGGAWDPLAADLDHILAHTAGVWEELRGKRIFITGGTGFFGCWLLKSFLWANDRLGLDALAVVLTRNAQAFRTKARHVAFHPAIRLHTGDVRSFVFPDGAFSHIIHAATPAIAKLNSGDPLEMSDGIVEGTRRTLDFAVCCGAEKFLLTSSGAVYGKQPPELAYVPESYLGAPDTMDPRSAYGEGKRVAELLCAIYHQRHGIQTKIARCFAFIGPYLPLDTHFAIGNFLRDRVRGGPIRVEGDGTPYRSYLYAADLMVWLWTILTRGEPCRPYNVGSEQALSVAEVACEVAGLDPVLRVQVARKPTPGVLPERYVPCTARARAELKLSSTYSLRDAILATAEWLRTVSAACGEGESA
jgi:dTDP-glucose 4,6-dehydratase